MEKAFALPKLPRWRPMSYVRAVIETRRQRLALSRLGPHLLDDIGLNQGEAGTEAAQPLWDVPQNWRRENSR